LISISIHILRRLAGRPTARLAVVLPVVLLFARSVAPAQSPVPSEEVQASFAPDIGSLREPLLEPTFDRTLNLEGAPRCAAASCHGGPHPGIASPTALRGNEYLLWLERDPHAQSWRTICSDASVAMMRRLKIMSGNEIVDRDGFNNCLACHNTRRSEPRDLVTTIAATEGVACEKCHGPSERWLGSHVRGRGSDGDMTGFIANDELLTRARMCVTCHVGDRDRDMNHDIIAAGHPALWFEMTSYHNRYPKHWRDGEAGDAERFQAQLWLAGQIASADAWLSLLEARAERQHTVSTWPELAAYDCQACHHPLRGGGSLLNPTTPPGSSPKLLSTARLSHWSTGPLEGLLRRQSDGESMALAESFDELTEAMQRGPRPSREEVVLAARKARAQLSQWSLRGSGCEIQNDWDGLRLLDTLTDVDRLRARTASWEQGSQYYLQLLAARPMWPGGHHGSVRPFADQLWESLQLAPGTTSPSYRGGEPVENSQARDRALEAAIGAAQELQSHRP
jgi:hypothetical protein